MSIKDKAINSMIWVSIDKTLGFFLVFISNLILARLLLPEDFGCIAMLHVFLAISDIILHGGFGAALIQKKEPTQLDYTSVFYVNLGVSIILYLILFICAPWISVFYSMPVLCLVLRIQALELIINAFTVVQVSILKRKFEFKKLAIRNTMSSFVGLIVGVCLAFCGCGIWSLVGNVLVSRIFSVFFLWHVSDWKPTWEFSISTVKTLFGFGGFMMISSIIAAVYDNLQSVLIGRFFSASDLGYVNQAKKLEGVPSGAISSMVSQVSFPVFSRMQDDISALKNGLRKTIKAISYINMPIMMLLVVVANPLIMLFYGERWLESVPYFQILCLSRLVAIIVPINSMMISAKGNGRLYFLIQLFKLFFSVFLIMFSIHRSIYAVMIAMALIPCFELLLCTIINHMIVGYGLLSQIRDVFPTFLISVVVSAFVYYCGLLVDLNQYLVMAFQIITFIAIYVFVTRILKFEAFEIYWNIIINRIKITSKK